MLREPGGERGRAAAAASASAVSSSHTECITAPSWVPRGGTQKSRLNGATAAGGTRSSAASSHRTSAATAAADAGSVQQPPPGVMHATTADDGAPSDVPPLSSDGGGARGVSTRVAFENDVFSTACAWCASSKLRASAALRCVASEPSTLSAATAEHQSASHAATSFASSSANAHVIIFVSAASPFTAMCTSIACAPASGSTLAQMKETLRRSKRPRRPVPSALKYSTWKPLERTKRRRAPRTNGWPRWFFST